MSHEKQTGKNIIICLDGTDNQFGRNLSNIVKLFRMLEREPGKQIAYYDPGVGTMGDPAYKTSIARKINKGLGLAFGRGLMKNLIEAYTFLMDNYEDGDKVFIFGFSRGAYTARVLAAFLKECGLFEKGFNNLLPYAMSYFIKKAPKKKEDEIEFYKTISSFRSTYGRKMNPNGDPRDPTNTDIPNYQLRIHFLGLFDTVKSYGWISISPVLRNEKKNPSVLNIRHAISIDEKRVFFPQMHWVASNEGLESCSCKEVWFAGVHSDVGGGYSEPKSSLAKIALEWMTHEAIKYGLQINTERYGSLLQKKQENGKWINLPAVMEEKEKKMEIKYSSLDPTADANESLEKWWHLAQLLTRKRESWENSKSIRTITNQRERLQEEKDINPFLVHQSVCDRIATSKIKYRPENLLSKIKGDIKNLPDKNIEKYISIEDALEFYENSK